MISCQITNLEYQLIRDLILKTLLVWAVVTNQSVENAGVAFVKGANERNELFEKNKQPVMYNEQVQTNKTKGQQSQGRNDLGMNSVM